MSAVEMLSSGGGALVARSAFARACAEPWLVRDSLTHEPISVEPGVRYFLRQLTRHGALTQFSCEGHPFGFYIVARMPLALALRVADAGYFRVELERCDPWRHSVASAESLLISIRLSDYQISVGKKRRDDSFERNRLEALTWAVEAWEKHFGSLWAHA